MAGRGSSGFASPADVVTGRLRPAARQRQPNPLLQPPGWRGSLDQAAAVSHVAHHSFVPRNRYSPTVGSRSYGQVMTAFVQTIIGALAAIGGGMLTAWWQEQHATETARRIRREERREEALRAFHAKTIEIVERIDQDYRAAENDPGAWREAWESAYPTVDELRKLWESDASGKIPEESITARYLEVRGQVHDC